jgi:hypothetical protein
MTLSFLLILVYCFLIRFPDCRRLFGDINQTGTIVIHRPHPTHPKVPNWSTQLDNLWVNTGDILFLIDGLILPPNYIDNSSLKQESQRLIRAAFVPV